MYRRTTHYSLPSRAVVTVAQRAHAKTTSGVSPGGVAAPSRVLLSIRPWSSASALSICRGRACSTPMAVRVSGVRFSLPGSIFGYAGARRTRTRPNLAIT
jgi:hypothetical protein